MTPARTQLLERLADAVCALGSARPARVAIDGPDAAGKTTLADELATVVAARGRPVIRASVDGWHRPRAERYRLGPDSPEAYYRDSFDNEALVACLLAPLGPGGDRRYHRAIHAWQSDLAVAPGDAETAPADAVLLLDGVFLQRPELVDHLDLRVFVAVPFAETLRRALVRDVPLLGDAARVRARYATRYVPGQQRYYDEARPAARAELVVDNTDPAAPSLVARCLNAGT
jgi:uridine kinase